MNAEIDKKLKNLSPEQLKKLMVKMGKNKKEISKMPRNFNNSYAITSAQKRMWFLSKLDPHSYLYTNPAYFRVIPEFFLDLKLWEESFNILIKRHAIMRTSFSIVDSEVKQIIHNSLEFKLNIIDFSGLDTSEKNIKLNEYLKNDGQKAIDVEAYPLFRHTVIRLGENEFVFAYTSHHIISDGWSNSRLFQEIVEIYLQIQAKNQPSSEEHPIQYIDYVNWEENWKKSPEYKKSLESWRIMLPDSPATLNLPTDYFRPTKIDYKGGMIKSKFDKGFLERITLFGKQNNLNLFHVLLSAFNILLHKYTGSREIVVGIPMANREKREFQSTVGLFLNTLPLRSMINEKETGIDFLRKVKETAQNVFFHQQFPFERIIEELNTERDLSVSPIFQVLFVFQNIPSLYSRDRMHIEPIKPDLEVSKYALNLWIDEVDEELQLTLTFQSKLFTKASVRKLLDRYGCLLNDLISNSSKIINELKVEEKESSSLKFEEIKETYLNLYDEHVGLSPNALAIFDGSTSLTYKELDEHSNKLARVIDQKIMARSKIIAVLLDKSTTLIATIVGIHKAGRAYLPLSEENIQHIDYMLKDANVDGVISETKYANVLKSSGKQCMYVDSLENEIKSQSPEKIDVKINVNDLAYLIYTSGSTGNPKGVLIEHKQITNYSQAVWKRFKLGVGVRCANVTSISTDLGNTQIFPVLAHGGTIDVLSKEITSNPIALAKYMTNNKVDTMKIVPSHLESLLAIEQKNTVLPTTLLILGGEKPSVSLIKKVKEHDPNLRIINHYGPSEATVGVITHEIKTFSETQPIPIGKGLEGNKVLICNENGKEQPSGIIGEIVVFGNNVARGYINQQSDKFIYKEGVRGYKTGDLGRVNNQHDIEFFGRRDRQVKVKGYRIELDPLEKMVKLHKGVEQSAVLKKDNSLVFYFTGQNSDDKLHSMLSAELKIKLPTYLWPVKIIALKKFPTLGNGKVDYTALSKIDTSVEEQIEYKQLPRDEVELKLCNIWEEVLNQKQIYLDNNFFDIGGNSLVAIELLAKINQQFNTELPIGILFEKNTVGLLAQQVRQKSKHSKMRSSVLLKKGNSETNIILVHPAGGDVFTYIELAKKVDNNFNVYGIQSVVGQEDVGSIELMASNYLNEIENIKGKPVFVGWSMGALVAYEMAIQYELKFGARQPVIILDQMAPAPETGVLEKTIEDDRLVIFASKIEHLINNKLGITKEAIRGKTAIERSEMFLKEFKKNNMVPLDLQADRFHGYLDKMIYHNNITTLYRGNRYSGEINLLKAKESVVEIGSSVGGKDYGWSHFADGQLKVYEVEGNHVTMMSQPNLDETARIISQCINSNQDIYNKTS